MPKTVGVIGGGVAGLAAIKTSLDEGLLPICFEKSDGIGGLWNYSPTPQDGYPSVYSSCVINTSKEMTCYSDFPIPKEFPNFMHRSNFQKYLELYASHFKLREYIQFNRLVEKVEKGDNFEETGSWVIISRDLQTGMVEREAVDFVMVCHGHLTEPNIPHFDGLKEYSGRVLHTHDYKDFRGFENKRVLVVGIGNSGSDVACDLSRHAEHAYISTRRGCYTIQRAGEFGQPFDQVAIQRWVQGIPVSLMRPIHYHKINYRYRHRDYGLSPNFRFDAGVSTISDDLPNRILVGAISIKSDIKTFTQTGAIFEDGSEVKDIDVVILATGYNYSFPFLDTSIVKMEGHFSYLYKLIFPPNIRQNTFAVVGLVQPFGSLPPVLEIQARVASRVFAGRAELPPPSVMLSELEKRKAFLKARYVDSARYSLQVYFIQYQDEIGSLIGCKPNLGRLFFTDPKLWYKMVFGPAVPPQWRLEGPGKWSGARDAIFSVHENTLYPMQTRKSGQNERDGLYDGWISLLKKLCLCVLALLFLNWLFRNGLVTLLEKL
ncbi:flavin-containing monooxygenase 5-like [Haliotis rubra]|uniref:flavin-containing monooxygenase 5-like n=1 Tax=Haliotis rubra TaxID=36100 RepID=UPI001EE5E973|nr:flavin-containing monooxygenase 5-like [Haliotis rubra]